MPRPFNPGQLGATSSSRARGTPSHRGDSKPRSASSALRCNRTPSNSGSSSKAFSTPQFRPQEIPLALDAGRRRVRTDSPLVVNHPIPEVPIEPIEQGSIHALLSESMDAADEPLESRGAGRGADSENEIVMAIDMREQQTIGCAYYAASEEKLYLMQDCKFADLTLFDTRTPIVC
jgi:hypothetical protein